MFNPKDSFFLSGLAALLSMTVGIGAVTGWVKNTVAVAHSDFHNINGELVVRVVGIPVVPVGAVMGWVP